MFRIIFTSFIFLIVSNVCLAQFSRNVIVSTSGLSLYEQLETERIEAEKAAELGNNDYAAVAAIILEGLGGKANVTSIDNCITRLRLEVKDQSKVDEKKIKSAGVAGVMRPGKTSVQVIVGTKVQFVADEFKKLCK